MTSENAAPAEMPGGEEIARALAQADEQNGGPPYEQILAMGKHASEPLFDRSRAILALFAPILAEKERQLASFRQYVAMQRHRAEAAEAALAAERERLAVLVEDACATPPADIAGMELEAFHRGADAMNNAIAAAIRAQGE